MARDMAATALLLTLFGESTFSNFSLPFTLENKEEEGCNHRGRNVGSIPTWRDRVDCKPNGWKKEKKSESGGVMKKKKEGRAGKSGVEDMKLAPITKKWETLRFAKVDGKKADTRGTLDQKEERAERKRYCSRIEIAPAVSF